MVQGLQKARGGRSASVLALRSSWLLRDVALSMFEELNRKPTTGSTRCVLVLEHPVLLDTLLCVEMLPLRVVRRILQSSVPGSSSTATEHAALAQTWPPVTD